VRACARTYAAQPAVQESAVKEFVGERLLVLDCRERNEARHAALWDIAAEYAGLLRRWLFPCLVPAGRG